MVKKYVIPFNLGEKPPSRPFMFSKFIIIRILNNNFNFEKFTVFHNSLLIIIGNFKN